MRKLILLFVFLFFANSLFAQQQNIDAAIKNISSEKNIDKKVDKIFDAYNSDINNNPAYVLEYGTKLLKQSLLDKDVIEKSAAYSLLGHAYRLAGNYVKGLEYHQKAVILAEQSNNLSLLAVAENQLGHIYKDKEDFDKAIQIYRSSAEHSEKGNNKKIKTWPLLNLASVYLSQNKLDSAFKYAQRGYEMVVSTNDESDRTFYLLNLAGVNSKMGNAELAITYYDMAIKKTSGLSAPRYLNMIYLGLADHYQRLNRPDSVSFYAQKAMEVVKGTAFFYLSSKPAKLLSEYYENINCDSTLKYSKLYKTANDSLFTTKANQQIQLMTFEEDLRKQQVAEEKLKAEEERKQNIQLAFIAFGIISFLIIFLIISRSIITNTRVIEILGVIALLIVFEFLNLLLHPFLERITHHSPILMLLGLVCIAAVLVPLHHKLEHWATHKLIEKNKAIRLASAKKIIDKLDVNPGKGNS